MTHRWLCWHFLQFLPEEVYEVFRVQLLLNQCIFIQQEERNVLPLSSCTEVNEKQLFSSLQAVCQLHFVMFCSDIWKQGFCLCVCTYIWILRPRSLMSYDWPGHSYEGQHIQPSLHSRCDPISKRERKTLLQKSRSWNSYFTVVAPQLLSESHLQYYIEYSWILAVKWQSRNKIKKPKIFTTYLFQGYTLRLFSEIPSLHSAVVAFFRCSA